MSVRLSRGRRRVAPSAAPGGYGRVQRPPRPAPPIPPAVPPAPKDPGEPVVPAVPTPPVTGFAVPGEESPGLPIPVPRVVEVVAGEVEVALEAEVQAASSRPRDAASAGRLPAGRVEEEVFIMPHSPLEPDAGRRFLGSSPAHRDRVPSWDSPPSSINPSRLTCDPPGQRISRPMGTTSTGEATSSSRR